MKDYVILDKNLLCDACVEVHRSIEKDRESVIEKEIDGMMEERTLFLRKKKYQTREEARQALEKEGFMTHVKLAYYHKQYEEASTLYHAASCTNDENIVLSLDKFKYVDTYYHELLTEKETQND